MNRPRVLCLLIQKDVSAWWRTIRPVARLEAQDYPVTWAMLDSVDLDKVGDYYDAVVLTRFYWPDHEYGRRWVERLQAQGVAVLYEVDDDWYSPDVTDRLLEALPTENDREALEQKRQDRIYALSLMDGVIASSPGLAEVCQRHTDAPVMIVPNAIDVAWFHEQLKDSWRMTPGPSIGWLGGPRLREDLEAVAIAWGRIAKRYSDVQFVVAGGTDYAAEHVPPERLWPIPWQAIDAWPRALANIDIGCCSVAPNAWNPCKTPIKVWEYTVCGASVVGTPTLYGQVITHGDDGLLAETPDEWEKALTWLLDSEPLRRSLRAAQSTRMMYAHTLEHQLHRWTLAWEFLTERAGRVRRPPSPVRLVGASTEQGPGVGLLEIG